MIQNLTLLWQAPNPHGYAVHVAQDGFERGLDILQQKLRVAMRQKEVGYGGTTGAQTTVFSLLENHM